jgi:DNA-3-methyladenine glycosylase II
MTTTGITVHGQSQDCNITPEMYLASKDSRLSGVIDSASDRWPSRPIENPIWGLIRIVVAQQVSTLVACRIAEKVKNAYPQLLAPTPAHAPEPGMLRALGVPQRRAHCCAQIVERSDEILARVARGNSWEEALAGIKGIGPWTIAVFRIMVLRDPDVLPLGDVGLERAIQNVYGGLQDVESLGEKWRPYRSVACWYLWRTLGNQQLG